MAAKVFGVGRRRSVSYLIALFDQDTGAIAAIVDGKLVTGYRTAATSAVAVDCMMPRGPVRLGVLGSGLEAQSHVRAIASVRTVAALRVFSPTAARREAVAATFAQELGAACEAVSSAEAAVAGAELVVAAARSRDESPILLGQWLQPGVRVVSIGSTLPEQREIDVEVVRRSDLIVCDVVDEVAEQTGDMLAAARSGVEFRDKMISLNELLCGRVPDRLNAARLPLFKSVGAAIQDAVVAELAVERAIDQGLATELNARFPLKYS
jgi:ornithine cyclodeaminase/alanine dehydrogenase